MLPIFEIFDLLISQLTLYQFNKIRIYGEEPFLTDYDFDQIFKKDFGAESFYISFEKGIELFFSIVKP